jgi:hypothetical protein
MASGKLDGLFTIFGVVLGSVLFGVGYPLYEGFYQSGDLGVLRLPDLLGVPQSVLAVAVTLMAVGMFIGGEKLENIFTKGNGPDRAPALNRRVFAALSAIAVVGLATMLIAQPQPAQSERPIESITPVAFAEMAIEDPTSYYLLDLRVVEDGADRIPGALAVGEDDPDASLVSDLPINRTLIVYRQGDAGRLPAAVNSFEGRVLALEGGYEAFAAAILEPPVLPENPSPAQLEEFKMLSALHAHFTGASVEVAPAPVRPKKKIRRATKKEGGC